MNAISIALQEIRYCIPYEVLQLAFVENEPFVGYVRNELISLDERIRNSVIRTRVMTNCNLVGGDPITVYLNSPGIQINEILPAEYVITIPKQYTLGRSIIAALSIVSNFGYLNTASFGYTSPLVSSANNMYNNLSNETIMHSSRLEMIGDNVLIVKDPSMYLFNTALRCVVENDVNMANLHPRFIPAFANLCVLATKAFIYNHCKIKMDQAFLYGGHELNAVTEIVDSYSDAEQMYQEFLKIQFRKIMYMNSSNNMSRTIRSMFGNNI